jgi:hypothetical protein
MPFLRRHKPTATLSSIYHSSFIMQDDLWSPIFSLTQTEKERRQQIAISASVELVKPITAWLA